MNHPLNHSSITLSEDLIIYNIFYCCSFSIHLLEMVLAICFFFIYFILNTRWHNMINCQLLSWFTKNKYYTKKSYAGLYAPSVYIQKNHVRFYQHVHMQKKTCSMSLETGDSNNGSGEQI